MAEDKSSSFVNVWEELLAKKDLEPFIQDRFEWAEPLIRLLQKCVSCVKKHRPRVLEIGCGSGVLSYMLVEAISAEAVAVDLLPEALRVAIRLKKYFEQPVDLIQADAFVLPFKDSTFDIVFSQGFVEHFRDPIPVLREQIRVLNPEGFLIIDVPQKYNPYTFYKRRRIRQNKWRFGWETEYSAYQLARMGREMGLSVFGFAGHGYAKAEDYGLARIRFWGDNIKDTCSLLAPYGARYSELWAFLEKRFGHYFMQCIAMAFVKGDREKSGE